MGKYDFKKAEGVQLSERGQYLTEGVYKLQVKRNIIKRTRDNKDLWILEAKVLESNNAEHPAGVDRNWVQNISDPQIGFKAVKGFVYAACGFDHKDPAGKKAIDEQLEPNISAVLNEAIEDPSDPSCKNALKDTLVFVEVRRVKTKAGTDFSLHTFSPVAKAVAA